MKKPVNRRARPNAPRVKILNGGEIVGRVSTLLHGRMSVRSVGTSQHSELTISDNTKSRSLSVEIQKRITTPDSVRIGVYGKTLGELAPFDVTDLTTEEAAQRIATEVQRLNANLRSVADEERDDEREWQFEHVRRLTRLAPTATIDEPIRQLINDRLLAAGFDGNKKFRSPGAAVAKAAEVLAMSGIEWGQVISLRAPSGRDNFDLAVTNYDDPFSPTEIPDSALSFHWHTFDTGRVEAIARVSTSR